MGRRRTQKKENDKFCRLTELGLKQLEAALANQSQSASALAQAIEMDRGTLLRIRQCKKPVTFSNIHKLFSYLGLDIEAAHYEYCSPQNVSDDNLFFGLLAEIPFPILQQAYRLCAEGCDLPFPQTIENLCQNLEQRSQSLRLRFVSLVVQHQSLSQKLRQSLCEWATEHGKAFNELKPSPVVLSEMQSSLMLQVEESRFQRKRYNIKACLVHDSNLTDLEIDPPGLTIAVSDDENATFTLEEIPTIISQTVAKCSQSVDLYRLIVQCFLPIELLNVPIESGTIRIGRQQRTLDAVCQAVIVRSLERQVTQDYSIVQESWKSRWLGVIEAQGSTCQAVMLTHGGNEADFYEALLDRTKVGCRFVGDDTVHEQRFDEIFIKGLAIALWVRSDHGLAEPDESLKLVDSCYVEQLPIELARLRRQQPQITQPLVLLWDNPYRPFPNIDYQSQSA